MGLTKASGNMYEWVSHCWQVINACEYECTYCYVTSFIRRPTKPELILPFPELGKGKNIFVCYYGDMFAPSVPTEMIRLILQSCRVRPGNQYIFQTKNPQRYLEFKTLFPKDILLGTTIETNDCKLLEKISKAPHPDDRAAFIRKVKKEMGCNTFVTIEPLLRFDKDAFPNLIHYANCNFVSIGADSKNHNLDEPSKDEVLKLLNDLQERGIEIRSKTNLMRLLR